MTITSITRIDPDTYHVAMVFEGKGSVVLEVQYFQSPFGHRAIRFDRKGRDEIRRVVQGVYPAINIVAGGYANKMDMGEVLTFPIHIGDVSKLV